MTDAFKAELAHFEELETTLQRRRRVLEIQCARFGEHIPAHIILELEDVEKQQTQVQVNLRQLRSTPADTHCPYLGLLTFQEDDSPFFFGRDALIGELLSKAEQTTFLAVLGPSGSGKSSVVRAGLIPSLKRGALPGSDQWYYLPPLKPTARPLNALAATLAAEQEGRLGDIASIRKTLYESADALLLMIDGLRAGRTGTRAVLVVDQAEELWTLAPAEAAGKAAFVVEQQQPFIKQLLTATGATDHSVLIILTMRADFLHRAIEHHDLARWIGEHDVMVSPLLPDELRDAITRPAALIGGSFEPGLVDTLVEEAIGRLGSLPLLEYTLLKLWEKAQRTDRVMTWAAYRDLGGVEGALAEQADAILAKHYTAEQLTELRAVLLKLVQPGEGAADTRRRVRIDDLVSAGSPHETVHSLLKPLADERLITTGYDPVSDEETVELSHEALIRAWPTLQKWINEERDNLRRQIQLEEAAKEWEEKKASPDFLWNGKRLADVQDWVLKEKPQLHKREELFLKTSTRYEERRQQSERSHYRGQAAGGAIGTGLGYGLVFALATAFDNTKVSAGSVWSTVVDTLIAFVFMFTIGSLVGLCLAVSLWLQPATAKYRVATTGLTGALAGCLAYILFLVGPGQATPDVIGLKHVMVGALLGMGVGIGAGLTGSDRRLLGMTLGSVMAFGLSGMLGGLLWSPLLLLIAGLVLGVSTALGFLIAAVEPDERMISLYSHISAKLIGARLRLPARPSFHRSSDRTQK